MKTRNKRNRKSRLNKKGGTRAYTPLTNMASRAAHFSGTTAKPQVWVGGRTRRRY
jgi:hypothetical protein